MFAILALSGLLVTQAASAAVIDEATGQTDVAYEDLAGGEARAAIPRLQAALAENPGDPALLINLGSAYAAIGDLVLAEQFYRSALSSDEHYRLELANGDWVDSRTAARRGLQILEQRGFALR